MVLTESESREFTRSLTDDQRHRVQPPLDDGLCRIYRQVSLLAEVQLNHWLKQSHRIERVLLQKYFIELERLKVSKVYALIIRQMCART